MHLVSVHAAFRVSTWPKYAMSGVRLSRSVWILRQRRRSGPPCLRAFHSPSPAALIPVLSIRRCKGPNEPRKGIAIDNILCRRHKVLKFGTVQFSLANSSKLSTNPVVCLKDEPKSTLIVRQDCIVVSV